MNKYEKAVAVLNELPAKQDRIISEAFDEFIRTIRDLEVELEDVKAQLVRKRSPSEWCQQKRESGNGRCEGCSVCYAEVLIRAETAEFKIKRSQSECRLKIQEHDCCYGDTPSQIHCPIDRPCTSHALESARHQLAHAIAAREEALDSNDKLRETLRRYEVQDKDVNVPPEGGGLT